MPKRKRSYAHVFNEELQRNIANVAEAIRRRFNATCKPALNGKSFYVNLVTEVNKIGEQPCLRFYIFRFSNHQMGYQRRKHISIEFTYTGIEDVDMEVGRCLATIFQRFPELFNGPDV